jgi:hypothetical protein
MGRAVKGLGIILSIVVAIICVIAASDAYSYEEARYIITGIVTLIVGIISSIVSGTFIEGFGELVENSQISKDYLYSIQNNINEIKNKK